VRSARLDYDSERDIEFMWTVATAPPGPRAAPSPCRWRPEAIERLRLAQIAYVLRAIRARRRISASWSEEWT
jgi:hypothetical protein